MLSAGTVRFLRKVFRLTRLVGSQPYRWPQDSEAEFVSSRSRYAIYLAQLILFCAYQSFVFARWIQAAFLDPNATPKRLIGLQYVACSYMVPMTFQLITYFNYGTHHSFVNRLLEHCRDFEEQNGNMLGNMRKCTSFMKKMYYVGPLVITMNTIALFRNPTAPHLLTSVVPDVKLLPRWQLLPIALVHLYIWCTQWATMYFYAFIAVAYSTAVLNMLSSLRPTRDLGHRLQYRTLEAFSRETQRLQVLQGNFNELYRWTVASVEAILVVTCVLSFYGAVRLEGIRGIHLAVIGTVALSILVSIWTKLGELYGVSCEVLRAWKRMESVPWFRMFMRSTPALRVQAGRFFYVDRMMILTLVGIIMQNTANLLLTV